MTKRTRQRFEGLERVERDQNRDTFYLRNEVLDLAAKFCALLVYLNLEVYSPSVVNVAIRTKKTNT